MITHKNSLQMNYGADWKFYLGIRKNVCMQNVDKIENVENPLEDKSSQFEDPSTQVFAQICIPLIEDDVYFISDLFSEIHVEDIWHASQETKGVVHIRLNFDIL